jgi:hypothetical protein
MAKTKKSEAKKRKRKRKRKAKKKGLGLSEKVLISLVLLIVILSAISIVFFLDPFKTGDGDGNGKQPTPPRAKIKVDKEDIFENETIEFDGEDSEGELEEYLWDFGDGDEGNGEVVTHTYREVGEFTVRLTVVDKRGDSHTDYNVVHVHYKETHAGSVSTTQTRSYVIPVEDMAENIRVKLTYPTGSVVVGQPSNDLDLDLYYPNGTLYASSDDQEPDEGNFQTEELWVPKQELMASFFGNWQVEVEGDTGLSVNFDIEVIVNY